MQDKNVEVAYVYNGRAVKIKSPIDIFKKIKPRAKTEVIVNNKNTKK
jgi:hypothetical protein